LFVHSHKQTRMSSSYSSLYWVSSHWAHVHGEIWHPRSCVFSRLFYSKTNNATRWPNFFRSRPPGHIVSTHRCKHVHFSRRKPTKLHVNFKRPTSANSNIIIGSICCSPLTTMRLPAGCEKNTDESTREMKVYVDFAVVRARLRDVTNLWWGEDYSFWRLVRRISQLLAITYFLLFLYVPYSYSI